MKSLNQVKIAFAALLLGAGMCSAAEANQNNSCIQTIAGDAGAVSKDVAAIAAQASAQGFKAAIAQFAEDMQTIAPTLNRPSQQAVEKFILDLETATSPSSPGGTAISPGERLVLTNDWVTIVTSTGITSAQITTISDDLTAVFASLKGISTAQLQSDFAALVVETEDCLSKN